MSKIDNPLNIDVLKETRNPIINECLINKKEVTINKETTMIEKGPCTRMMKGKCEVYWDPTAKWKNGDCPMATHIIYKEDEDKFKLNPIKASKKGQG